MTVSVPVWCIAGDPQSHTHSQYSTYMREKEAKAIPGRFADWDGKSWNCHRACWGHSDQTEPEASFFFFFFSAWMLDYSYRIALQAPRMHAQVICASTW